MVRYDSSALQNEGGAGGLPGREPQVERSALRLLVRLVEMLAVLVCEEAVHIDEHAGLGDARLRAI